MKDTITIEIHIDDQDKYVGISTEVKCKDGRKMSEWVKEKGEEHTGVKIVRDTYSFLQLRSDPEKIIEIPKLLHGMLIREAMELPIEETIKVFRTLQIVPATANDTEAEQIVEMARALIPEWNERIEQELKEEQKEKEMNNASESMMFGLSKSIN